MIRLSKTSKLDGVQSWSLAARDTCPGSLGPDGELVPACAGCYAVGGNYRFPNVKRPREENRADWKRAGWVEDMTRALENARYFRWFDSGDVYSVALAEKILSVMERTPHTKHWLPTRSYKFAKFAAVLERMGALPNVMVRYSSDSVTGEYVPYLHGSTITPASQPAPEGAYLCPATASPAHDGKCGACRACYDKGVPVVAYVAHGRTMAKIVRKELDKRGVS